MSDGGINQRYKERWAEAVVEHGEILPRHIVHQLQEQMRLEWVVHTKGRLKVTPPVVKDQEDGQQEAEGQEEEDPGTPDGTEHGEPGQDESELAPAETLETRRVVQRGSKGRKSPAKRARKAPPKKRRS